MGNRETGGHDDFQKMVHEMRKDQTKRVNIHPEKKYLALMVSELEKTKLHEHLREIIRETLQEKVTEVELIESITCINALKNNEFDSSTMRSSNALRDKPESKYVRINFGENFLKKILRKLPININFSEQNDTPDRISEPPQLTPKRSRSSNKTGSVASSQSEHSDLRDKLKNIAMVMRKELNRISHPFGKLNKSFAEYIEAYSDLIFPPGKPGQEEQYQKMVKQILGEWCSYLQNSCLSPYKKWIMSYTGLEEAKYTRWIKNIIMQEIWAVNNGYLFSMLSTVIYNKKVALQINILQIQYSAALLTPSLFNIDPKLQIEGHFFDSIYELSEIVTKLRPEQVLSQLEVIKKRICTDIDNYHRLFEKGEMYEIDSDNILGIVAYILCKIASKIQQIYVHLIFLRIVYGQNVYYSMGVGSYMLSTIFGALEFLESPQFRELIDLKKAAAPAEDCNDDSKSGANHSETKGTLSQKQEHSQKMRSSHHESEKLVSSMILPAEQERL